MSGVFLIFNFGGGEIMIILLFVVMFFGSKRIPEIARTLGKGIREVRNATNEIKREIRDQADDAAGSASNLTKGFYDPAKEVKNLAGTVRRGFHDIINEEDPVPVKEEDAVTEETKPEGQPKVESTSGTNDQASK